MFKITFSAFKFKLHYTVKSNQFKLRIDPQKTYHNVDG